MIVKGLTLGAEVSYSRTLADDTPIFLPFGPEP